MSPEIQQAVVAYVVPALILALLELRRRRLLNGSYKEKIEASRRVSDFELGQQLRDEIREENRELRERVEGQDGEISGLHGRVAQMEARVAVLSALILRHGIPLPDWPKEAS